MSFRQSTGRDMQCTIIIRDDSAVAAGASDRATFRTVRLTLTPDQQEQLKLRNRFEVIEHVIIEPSYGKDT